MNANQKLAAMGLTAVDDEGGAKSWEEWVGSEPELEQKVRQLLSDSGFAKMGPDEDDYYTLDAAKDHERHSRFPGEEAVEGLTPQTEWVVYNYNVDEWQAIDDILPPLVRYLGNWVGGSGERKEEGTQAEYRSGLEAWATEPSFPNYG